MGNANTERIKKLAYRYKAAATEHLGGCCQRCRSTKKLEFHHIYGRDYNARELSCRQRYKTYLAEAVKGLLELLCKKCHRRIHLSCNTTCQGTHPPKPRQTSYSSTRNPEPFTLD